MFWGIQILRNIRTHGRLTISEGSIYFKLAVKYVLGGPNISKYKDRGESFWGVQIFYDSSAWCMLILNRSPARVLNVCWCSWSNIDWVCAHLGLIVHTLSVAKLLNDGLGIILIEDKGCILATFILSANAFVTL